jgi:hypothetical protein
MPTLMGINSCPKQADANKVANNYLIWENVVSVGWFFSEKITYNCLRFVFLMEKQKQHNQIAGNSLEPSLPLPDSNISEELG